MMISKAMAKKLNDQINNEFASFWIYQQMGYAFDEMGLPIFAKFLYKQAGEEREHGEKIGKYLLDQGCDVKLAALPKPKGNYKSAADILTEAYNHEKKITDDWNKIADLAVREKDHASRVLADWFIEEQVEEVSTMAEVLGMVKMAKTDGQILMLEGRLYRMIQG
ncbi:MAG: ferritin [candidate division Zixibacteria bacterium]